MTIAFSRTKAVCGNFLVYESTARFLLCESVFINAAESQEPAGLPPSRPGWGDRKGSSSFIKVILISEKHQAEGGAYTLTTVANEGQGAFTLNRCGERGEGRPTPTFNLPETPLRWKENRTSKLLSSGEQGFIFISNSLERRPCFSFIGAITYI